MLLLSDDEIRDVNPDECVCCMEDCRDLIKAQLKKIVAYLKGCKGELASHNNESFVCTFEIPADEWMDILKEVDDV